MPKVTPMRDFTSVISWTVAPWGVVWMTVPTSPPLATTGMPTMTPLSRPLEMSTVAAKFVGESAVTWAATVGKEPTKGTSSWVLSCSSCRFSAQVSLAFSSARPSS